jgi:S1-C subfamily serine protease
MFVPKGTPASKAGFQAGDIIQSVNGIDTKYLGGLLSVKEMLREKPGTKYQIEVARNGESKRLKLVLKDMFKS